MNYAEIQLTQGKVAIVDASDFDWLNQWNWCANKGRRLSTGEYPWYTSRTENNRHLLMHRLVVGARTAAQQAAQRLETGRAAGAGMPLCDPRVQRALLLVVRAGAGAVVGAGAEVGEGEDDALRVDVRQPERADTRGVDHPAAVGQREGDG